MPVTPQFRIRFDVPAKFALEPGFIRQIHSHDFRPQATDGKTSLVGTWQDPLTGLIMLRPSFLDTRFSTGFRGLDNWNKARLETQEVWDIAERGADHGGVSDTVSALMMTSSVPEQTGTMNGVLSPSGTFDQIVNIAFVGEVTELAESDHIEIALESKTTIAPDQGFTLHYNSIGDQMHRKRNWFSVTWDKYQVHFSMDGSGRIFEFALRGSYTDTPKLREEFEIASPSELIGRDGYISFVPIPGYGLRIIHSNTPQSLPNKTSSARSNSNRGALIELPTREVDGHPTIFDESRVWIALNPYHPMVIGFQEIVYSTTTSATYIDAAFDPGYKPSFNPDDVSAFVSASNLRGALLTASLREIDDSKPWTANPAINAGDRQARVKVTMQTTDAKYTPFLLGYGAHWNPVIEERDTTPIEPSALYRLEFSEDVLANFEGHCTVLMETFEQRRLVERGDTTYIIEKSIDNGGTWKTVNGGLAQIDGEVSAHMDLSGAMYYIASWKLGGMDARFDEMSNILENAFDGLTPGQGIDVVLNACGFPFLSSMPAELMAIKIPQTPKGQNWRFAPREGDKGDHIIRDLLLLVKTQHQEWRLRFDWDAQEWVAEKRKKDTAPERTWTFTAFPDDIPGHAPYSVASRVALLSSEGTEFLKFKVTPPECNVVQPFGLTATDQNGQRVPGTPLVNVKSLTDKTSPDYLGRFISARPMVGPLEDLQWINWMGRRVYDAAAHRRVQPIATGKDFIGELIPDTHVRIRTLVQDEIGETVRGNLFSQIVLDGTGAPVEEHLWIKRKTTVLDYNKGAGEIAPVVTYALDTVWDSEIK